MAYTLVAGPTAGRIDHDDLETIDIRDGRIEVDDYDLASELVRRHSHVEWIDGDPGDDADGDAAEGEEPADGESTDEEAVEWGGDGESPGDGAEPEPEPEAEAGDFDAEAWLDQDYTERESAVRSGDVDEHLDTIVEAERSENVKDAVELRREELEG